MAKKTKTARKKTASKEAGATRRKTRTKKVSKKTSKKKTVKKKAVKKTTKKSTKKKTASRKAVRTNKATAIKKGTGGKKIRKGSPLTPAEIAEFRQLLYEKRAELIGDVSYIENEALRKSRGEAAGDLSSMPIHMADIGSDNFEQEFSLGLMDSERKILSEISAALQRIDEGTYGVCEGTGELIPKARLKASPWARYCIRYAEMVEKGLVVEGEAIEAEDEDGNALDDSGEYEIVEDEFDDGEGHDLEDTTYESENVDDDD